MRTLGPEKASRNALADILAENTDGSQLRSKKTSSPARAYAALSLIGFLALFTQLDQRVNTPNSLKSSLSEMISDFISPHLYAQSPLTSATYSKLLAYLLYDPENGNDHLMLGSGDKLTDITGPLSAKGFISIKDISLDESEKVVCAAFDTTDIRHNWEIIKVAPNGKVTTLTNTSELDESSPSMSNDQKKLAYVAGGSIHVQGSGKKTMISPRRGRAYVGVRWTPEDRLLVTVEEGRRSYIAEIDLANPYYVYRLTYSEYKVTIRNPVISPDGTNLVYVIEKGGNTEIVTADRYGNNSRILSFGDNIVYSDSATILFCREFNSRSHLFFINGSGDELEALIPAVIYDSGFIIRSISSYTPYIIPPESPEEPDIEGNSENKDDQRLNIPDIHNGYLLLKNYPDPFNPTTTIQYELPFSSNVRINVLNIRGRSIRTLVDQQKAAGRHSVEFDATGLSSGVYFYRLVAGDFTLTRKMVLLK